MTGKYRIVFAIWFMTIVNYMERVIMGFAGPSVMQTLHIDPATFGVVLSSFAVGYLLSQIPGGILADRLGTRSVLIVGPLFWALFTGITGLIASVASLVAIRLLFGMAEGLSNGALYKAMGDNFGSKDRAQAVSVWVTAYPAAPAFTGPLVGILLASFAWPSVFVMLAIPALVAVALNYAWLPSPQQAANADRGGPASMGGDATSMRDLLRLPSLWLIGAAFGLWSIAYWGFLGWMPSYLALERHIDIKSSGMLGGIPYVFGLIGVLASGWLGSNALHRFRPHLLAGNFLLACVSLFFAYAADSLASSLAGLSGAAFFIYAGLSTYGALVLDLAPERARAAYSGIVSTIGQVGGVIAPVVIGYLVTETGSFASGFAFMIGALCIGAVCALSLVPFSAARPSPGFVIPVPASKAWQGVPGGVTPRDEA